METAQWVSLLTVLVTGIGIPLLIFMSSAATTQRRTEFQRMHERLDHFDTCIDDVRGIVYSKGVTREELNAFKADITEIISRQRIAISSETNGLHNRIMRLEDFALRKDGDD